MNLDKAKDLALKLIAEHCPHYTFKFDQAKKRFGYCRYTPPTIQLSKYFVELNDEKDILKVILHEIAHALTPGHHHDKTWKAKCIELRGDGNRTHTYIMPKGIYTAICDKCGRTYNKYKKPTREYSCKCFKGFNRDYLLTYNKNKSFDF